MDTPSRVSSERNRRSGNPDLLVIEGGRLEFHDQNTERLTPDSRNLEELEGVIRRGLETFVEVGNAIREIRERRLYKGEYDTFEEYCRERWGWDRRHANRHIEAADTVEVLGSIDPKPANVAQARELAPLAKEDPETARRVWGGLTAEHGDDLTAKHVKKAVEEVKEAKTRRETLPPEVRTVVEGSDPEDTSLSRNPAQLKHLGDIAAKRGPEKAAETAERVANGEFRSTFDAYPEIKAEQGPTVRDVLGNAPTIDLPDFHLPEERKVYRKIIANLKDITRLDNEQIVGLCKSREEAEREVEYLTALIDRLADLRTRFANKQHERGDLKAVK